MTKQEMQEILDDPHNTDRWCIACDWLEDLTGSPVANGEYTQASIREAVAAEDAGLLEEV